MKQAANSHYDYIIAGGGAAGLSLALALQRSTLTFSRVLIIDSESKTKNDRTWCYWTKEKEDVFSSISTCNWKYIKISSQENEQALPLDGYSYKLIKGIDFYAHAHAQLRDDVRFEFLNDTILNFRSFNNQAEVQCTNGLYTSSLLFNSAIRTFETNERAENLVQHFEGWKIRTTTNCFTKNIPTFMDFSVKQYNDCRFVYILPFSENEAIVEYTGFSKTSITTKQYKQELENYLTRFLNGAKYDVLETESGIIPMYESKAINSYGNSVIAIGTAGGASKASTGFTFYFIQKHCRQIITALEKNQPVPATYQRKKRFIFYDRILLHLLYTNKLSGKQIFTTLFNKNKVGNIFDFLNEESSVLQELQLFITLPLLPFSKAAFRKLR